jgi:ABC-type antimicrobial peptide transport system permease subunit
LLSLGVSATGAQGLTLTQKTVQEFEAIPGVVDAAPLARFPALITYKGLTGNVFIQAVEPPYLRYAGVTATYGDVFNDEDIGDTSSIMISPAVLKLFGIADEDAEAFIGQKVSFRLLVPADDGTETVNEILLEKEYIVRGITKEASVLNAMMMLPELRNYVGIEEFERVQVNVDTNTNLPIVEELLIEKGYRVQVVLATFGGIALVVSAIGMFNTMTVTLLERTKEIGIMRTIGASPNDVKYLFVSESIVVGFLGGVSGIVIGVVLGTTVNILLNVLASQFGGQAVGLFAFPLDFLLFIALFSAAVGYATGIFPAKRASTLNPLDAIRYE